MTNYNYYKALLEINMLISAGYGKNPKDVFNALKTIVLETEKSILEESKGGNDDEK